MPRLSSTGQAVMGVGDGPLSVDGQLIRANGGGPSNWLDDSHILHSINGEAELLSTALDGTSVVLGPGCNETASPGDGRWLGWRAGVGVLGALGEMRGAGLARVITDARSAAAPDGTMAYVPIRSDDGSPTVMLRTNGEVLSLPPAIYGLSILRYGVACWNDGAGGFGTIGLPPLTHKPGSFCKLVNLHSVLWLIYWANGIGLIAHRAESPDVAYFIEKQESRCFHWDAREVDGKLAVAYSTTTGEGPGDLVKYLDVTLLPHTAWANLTPSKPEPIPLGLVEPLVGKWLVSYYEQNGNVPDGKLPPGNAMVAVRNQNNDHGPQPRPMIITAETEGKVTGTIIAYRIGSEAQFVGEVVTIEVMEARARAAADRGHRPWFYWDEPTTPRAPVLPTGSVIEVFGFCLKDESIPDWERDRRQRLREAASWPGGYLLAISAQTHDTNDSLKPEPSVMIPPMVRLCQWARAEFGGRFLGLDIFCNSGRDFPDGSRGGLTANPQLVPHWTKVFSGVTGLPDALTGVVGGNGGGGGNVLAIRLGPYPRTISRGAPYGLDVPWDVDSDRPIARGRFKMQDGSTAIEWTYKIAEGTDGRYIRGLHFKPTIDGPHRFELTLWDDQDHGVSVTSEPVTVTSDPIDVEPPPFDVNALIAPANLRFVQDVARDFPHLNAGDATDQVAHRMNKHYGFTGANIRLGRKARNNNPSNPNCNLDGLTVRLDLTDNSKKKLIDIWVAGEDPGLRPTWDVRPAHEEAGNGFFWPPLTPSLD